MLINTEFQNMDREIKFKLTAREQRRLKLNQALAVKVWDIPKDLALGPFDYERFKETITGYRIECDQFQRSLIDAFLAGLHPNLKYVIDRRFRGWTDRRIADAAHVSRERVRQQEAKALRLLRSGRLVRGLSIPPNVI